MTKRRVLWLVAALVALAVFAVLIPGSPAYLPRLLERQWRFYDGHTTSYWIEALNSPDEKARLHAIHVLGVLGPEASEAVPALSTLLLESDSRGIRIEASLALAKMAPASRAAVPALIRALEDDEPCVRMNVTIALTRLREEARPAIPALSKALKDKRNRTNAKIFHHTIQQGAALALGWVSRGSPEAVPVLLETLKSGDTLELRLYAARALARIGAEAHAAVPLLRPMLKDKDDHVREIAEDALRQIEGQRAEF